MLDALHDLREFLDPAIEGRYRLYHESVADALTANPASQYYVDLVAYHRRIAAWYGEAYEKRQAWSACDGYGLRYLPAHRINAEDWSGVTALLTDFDFLEAKCRATSVYELETDYRSALVDWQGESYEREILQAFEERLRLESHHIHRAPELLFPHLYNHLTWLDGPDSPDVLPGRIHKLCEWSRAQAPRTKSAGWLRMIQNPTPAPQLWLRSLGGHTERVVAVAVTSDGQQVVSGAEDNTVKVWELSSGRLLRSLEGHTGSVETLAVTPDGQQVVSGADDNTVKVWNLQTGNSCELFGNDSAIRCLALSPDGRWLTCGDAMGRVWIFEWVK